MIRAESRPRIAPRIDLRFNQLSLKEQAAWRERLAGLERECGCGVGSIVSVTGVAIYCLAIYTHLLPNNKSLWVRILVGFLVLLGAGLVGKALGIWLARRKRDRALGDLEKRLHEISGQSSGT